MIEDNRKNLRQRARFLRDALALESRPVVCDVGANPAYPPPYTVLQRQGGCDVVGFEPQKDHFERLIEKASDSETYFNAALGKPGPATLHVYESGGFTSLYSLRRASLDVLQRFHVQLDNEQQIEVELQSLDGLKDLPKIDMLKIDVQGAELDIIAGGREALSRAVVIYPEVRFFPLYEGEPTFGELDTELREQGFAFHKLRHPVTQLLPSPHRAGMERTVTASQWVDADAVYVRNLETIDNWDADQVRKLALFAGTVFDSQDLALMCLDRLARSDQIAPAVPDEYAALLPDKYFKARVTV